MNLTIVSLQVSDDVVSASALLTILLSSYHNITIITLILILEL